MPRLEHPEGAVGKVLRGTHKWAGQDNHGERCWSSDAQSVATGIVKLYDNAHRPATASHCLAIAVILPSAPITPVVELAGAVAWGPRSCPGEPRFPFLPLSLVEYAPEPRRLQHRLWRTEKAAFISVRKCCKAYDLKLRLLHAIGDWDDAERSCWWKFSIVYMETQWKE